MALTSEGPQPKQLHFKINLQSPPGPANGALQYGHQAQPDKIGHFPQPDKTQSEVFVICLRPEKSQR